MSSKTLLPAITCFFIYCSVFAQEPPTVTPCGEQHVCLSDSTYELCVVITVDPSFSNEIDRFEIYWGDGDISTIDGSLTPEEQNHIYDPAIRRRKAPGRKAR